MNGKKRGTPKMKHRPFAVDGDRPITENKKLLKYLLKAFNLLDIYQPIGTISSYGIKEAIAFLNYYKNEIIQAHKARMIKEAIETKITFVGMESSNG